jgi:hypothetical protein
MSALNGHHRNGKANDDDISSILEDWIFLVEEHSGVLARATELGLTVDTWTRLGVEDGLKGKKVILVFNDLGDDRKEEFEALGRVRAAGPMLLRTWKPHGLGDEKTPTLKELGARYISPGKRIHHRSGRSAARAGRVPTWATRSVWRAATGL